MYRELFDRYNEYDTGIAYKTMNKENLTSMVTPPRLCDFMASQRTSTYEKVLDLMSGTGAIASALDMVIKDVWAIELIQENVDKTPEGIHALCGDITDAEFAITFLNKHAHSFDAVYHNPCFAKAFHSISFALAAVKPGGLIHTLLPSDYFATSSKRYRMYLNSDFTIVSEFVVGKWNYNKDKYSHCKRTCDSVFIIKERDDDKDIPNAWTRIMSFEWTRDVITKLRKRRTTDFLYKTKLQNT